MNVDKRSFAFMYLGFISIVFGFAREDESFIKTFISKRAKTMKQQRERQFAFFEDVLKLVTEHTKIQ